MQLNTYTLLCILEVNLVSRKNLVNLSLMGLIQSIINKLVGFDVFSKQNELEYNVSVLEKENTFLRNLLQKHKSQLATAEKERDELGNLVNELTTSVTSEEKKKQELLVELTALKSLVEKEQQRVVVVSKQLEESQASLTVAQNAKDKFQLEYEEETARIESQLKAKELQILAFQKQMTSVQAEKEELENQVTDLRLLIAQKSREVMKLSESVDKLKQENDERDNDIAEKELTIKSSQEERDSILKELHEKNELLDKKDCEINQLKNSLTELQEQVHQVPSSTDEVRELENQIQVLQEQLSDSRRESDVLNKQLEQKENEINEIGNKLAVAHEHIAEYQEKIDAGNTIILNQEEEIQRLNESVFQLKGSEELIVEHSQENAANSIPANSLDSDVQNNTLSQSQIVEPHSELELEVGEPESPSMPVHEPEYKSIQGEDDAVSAEENAVIGVGSLSESKEEDVASSSQVSPQVMQPHVEAEFEKDEHESQSMSVAGSEHADLQGEDGTVSAEEKTVIVADTRVKSKEEEAVESSGGSMDDFPDIISGKPGYAKGSIEFVYNDKGERIDAKDFFRNSADVIARQSRQLVEVLQLGTSDFVCGKCKFPVRIGHRKVNGVERLFFVHAVNVDCEWSVNSYRSEKHDGQIDDGGKPESLGEVVESKKVDDNTSGEKEYSKDHTRILKEMIYCFLSTPKSEELGISEVRCDSLIRSKFPYMKWRKPDISFKYKGKDIVILMQSRKHNLRTLVDRDVFFRINNYQVLWIFGVDSDDSYGYMRKFNYRNTFFDCHRNVFVFDREAQQASEERNTLCLKYNWLDEHDKWGVTKETMQCNGLIADLSDFIFDDEYCKPYIVEANEPYFKLHPDAKEQFLLSRKSREQVLEELEHIWKGEPSYIEALQDMRSINGKVAPYEYMGLWGFCFRSKKLMLPVFTEKPVDLHNGFYMVKQGETAGVVNYFNEVVMDWTVLKCDKLSVDVQNKRVLFCENDLWGVADFSGNILIQPQFDAIKPWSDEMYRVSKSKLWGLHGLDRGTLVQFSYNSIGELKSDKAEAVLCDKDKSWVTYKGFLDSNGNVIDSVTKKLNDKYIAFEKFERWGVRTTEGEEVIEPTYEELLPWTAESVRVKKSDKWGVVALPNENIVVAFDYDSIGALENGKAVVSYVGVTNIIDEKGDIQSEISIKLQDGFVKSKIGNKWGIEKDGKEVVPHKYDEIGSFRRRLIGVINSSIVKLNAYYDYPIPMSGRCIGLAKDKVKVDISGVSANIFMSSIEKPDLKGKIIPGYVMDKIAFRNILFSDKLCTLFVVSDDKMTKKIGHGDKDSDFSMDERVTGVIKRIMRYRTEDGKQKTTKVFLRISDGRETMVPRRFFTSAGLKIVDFAIGDSIQIQKKGYDDELDQTKWKIISATHSKT